MWALHLVGFLRIEQSILKLLTNIRIKRSFKDQQNIIAKCSNSVCFSYFEIIIQIVYYTKCI